MKKLFRGIIVLATLAFGLNAALPANTTVIIIPVHTPMPQDSDYSQSAQAQVEAVRNGTITSLTKVTMDSFTYSATDLAELGGKGGTIIWWIDVMAPEGQTISLDQVLVTITSRDGALKKEQTFAGSSYTPFAVGYLTDDSVVADGKIITSGDASQKAKRIIIGVFSKAFPATNAAKVQEVRDYLSVYPDWFTTCTVGTTSKTLTFTEPPPVVVTAIPSLFIRPGGTNTLLWAETNGYTGALAVQWSTNGATFYNSGMTLMSGGSLVVDTTAISSALYRLHK